MVLIHSSDHMEIPPAPEIIERLVRSSRDATVRLRVRSSLNPMLWLCAIVCPTCLGFALLFQGWLRDILAISGVLPVAVACGCYIFLMLHRPDDLKSEEFQLRKIALELIETKGGKIKVEPVSVPDISNSESPSLPASEPERDEP